MDDGHPSRIDDLEVTGVLGEGGMGRVFATRDQSGQRFAVKVLAAHFVGDDEMVQRFEREAEALIKVQSPHVVRGVRHGKDNGAPFLVMEVLDGQTLRERLASSGPLPLGDALRLCAEAARGLKAAYDVGLIHRDVKPENCVVLADDTLKVIDFGLAQPIDGSGKLTSAGLIVGSPAYMAPERSRGEDATVKSDLYALGCSLFEMLTGKPPYEAETEIKTLSAHLTEPVPDIKARRTDVPDAVAELVARLLEKEPAQRVGTYDAVLTVLDRISVGLPTGEMPAVVVEEAKELPDDEPTAAAQPPVADEAEHEARAEPESSSEEPKPIALSTEARPTVAISGHPARVWLDATGALASWAAGRVAADKRLAGGLVGGLVLLLIILIAVAASGGDDTTRSARKERPKVDYPEDDIRGWNVKELLAYLGDDDIDDILAELAGRDASDLEGPLTDVAKDGNYLQRHRALTLLEEKELATDALHQAVALKDIDNGPSCVARREGLDRLVEHAVDEEALEAIQRLKRRRSTNGCMDLDDAEDEISDRLD